MTRTASAKKPHAAKRFDREAWLNAAIEVLAREGQAKLRVDKLAGQLGVTKGSFYHHFKNRRDFVHALLKYWSSEFTERVIREIDSLEISAEKRLLRLMETIQREELERFDIAFRSWAAQDQYVAKEVRKVDLKRFKFARSLFSEMGFRGADLKERIWIWLVFHSAQRTVYVPEAKRNSPATIRRHHAFFTRRSK